MNILKTKVAVASALIFAAFSGNALAAYPEETVYIPIGHVKDSISDKIIRLFGEELSKQLKVDVDMENFTGQGGTLTNQRVTDADPDGYTLTIANVSTLTAAGAYDPLSKFDPLKDFTFIGNIAVAPTVLVVASDAPYSSYKELENTIQKSKGKYSYGSSPRGALPNILMETLKHDAHLTLPAIVYKGTPQAVDDVANKKVEVAIAEKASALNQINNGGVKVLAVGNDSRLPEFPNAPTFKELGYGNINRTAFFSVVGPANMPQDVVAKIQGVLEKMSKNPEVIAKIEGYGAIPKYMGGKEFNDFIKSENTFYQGAAAVVKKE